MLDSATRVEDWGGFNPGRHLQAPDANPLSDARFSPFAGSATNTSISALPYDAPALHQDYVAPPKQVAPEKREDTGKLEAIDATVRDIGEHFVLVTAAPGGEIVELQVPVELCPPEIRFEGMPISISIDTSSRYSSLKVERRAKKTLLSEDFKSRFTAMTEWADSL
ncbi:MULTISPECIES: hypothetical protein [Sinorhizobium]|uniref:Uncharacterized protein n=2 Tax=Sinorhizobium TaxID=28105 RepID=A0A6N7LKH2_SINTE|nr:MULTISPECIES: hypothetical protein [Sinorhizobium]MBB4189185.1 hypothetical protein [Sinorhizobium terangae]MCZ4093494.1 hypothetical protein [Sinorhizobium psoraleae]MQX18257.1 hypothetical protein [Sinorhizobium terangae]